MLIPCSVLALFFLALGVIPLEAQQPDSGTVNVIVQEPMGPVEAARIRSENRSASTDANGRARLALPAGQRTLVIERIGYVPKSVGIMVIADTTTSVTVDVEMKDMVATMMQEVIVSATRTERLAGK